MISLYLNDRFLVLSQGHFKQMSEFYEELGGKSTLFKRPMNFVLIYPPLDICVDTRFINNCRLISFNRGGK